MFWPIFAYGLWWETFKASFSQTNQIANNRRRQKKHVKIFQNFTYLHQTQPGQKTVGNIPNLFEDIDSPDVWVLDAGLNTSPFWFRYSVSDRQNQPRLAKSVYATSIDDYAKDGSKEIFN